MDESRSYSLCAHPKPTTKLLSITKIVFLGPRTGTAGIPPAMSAQREKFIDL
jgi:hypothetical protein